jgi:phosphoglycerate dehydrogenase-like enzyme
MRREFKVGITPDFTTQAKGLLEPALEKLLRPVAGIDCEFMRDTAGIANPEILNQYDAVIVLDYQFPASSFVGVSRPALVARWGVGYDRIDVEACTQAEIILSITPDAVRRAVAEAEIALIFALAKNLRTLDRNCRSGQWREGVPTGLNIEGKTLGTVGFGGIGQELFRLARGMGFGRLLAATRGVGGPEDAFAGVEFKSLETVLRESDFVTINCPLNETTRGMIGARQLALMKPTAYIINTARGAIVDEVALAAALREQRIAGAGVDVFEAEPVPADHPFFELNNVILCPHSVARTWECTSQASLSCCRSVLAVFQGKAPSYVANPEVLSRRGAQKKLDAFRESCRYQADG